MGHLPTVLSISLKYIEPVKADRIARYLRESLEVPHQGIGEGITCGVRISIRGKHKATVVGGRPRVLILAVPGIQRAEFHGVLSDLYSDVVRGGDIRCRCEQEVRRRTLPSVGARGRSCGDSGKTRGGNSSGKRSDEAQRRGELETVCRPQVEITDRGNLLLVPIRVEFHFVDQARRDDRHPSNLIVVSGTVAKIGIHRQLLNTANIGAEGAESIIHLDVVVNVTIVEILLVAGVIIDTYDVLAPIRRTAWLEKGVALLGRRRERASGGQLFRSQRIDCGNCFAVRSDAPCAHNVIGDGASRRSVWRSFQRQPWKDVAKVALRFGLGGQRQLGGALRGAKPLPFLAGEEE